MGEEVGCPWILAFLFLRLVWGIIIGLGFWVRFGARNRQLCVCVYV